MATAFPEVKPFPSANPRAVMGGNRPPLGESIVTDFDIALAAEGLDKRVANLIAKGEGAGPCPDEEMAGKYGDFIKLAAAATKAVEGEREKLNRPLLTAQRNLKGRSDVLVERLNKAVRVVRGHLTVFMNEQERIAAERRRQAEAERRAAQEAADAEARRREEERARHEAENVDDPELVEMIAPEPELLVEIKALKVEEPVVRGDYGARVGTTTRWNHEIISVRQLPDRILKHAKVVEALDKVIAAEVRGGAREIKGTRIWSEQQVAVR